jgi:antitoxin (DNA-binding transcriptional repressor) of toxin-antitoxin stability system
MVTVSIQDVRFDFARVKSSLDRGEELLLTYRNKPLAKIIPIDRAPDRSTDPALEFGSQPESLDPMSNEEIDRAIYG